MARAGAELKGGTLAKWEWSGRVEGALWVQRWR